MSQRKEKYARRMEGRVDKLEECVGKLGVDMTSQRIRLNSMEDDLAVYRAAVAHREEKAARRAIQEKRMERQRAEAERRERRTQRIAWLSIILAALVLTAVAVMATTWAKADDQLSADPATPPCVTTLEPCEFLPPVEWEDPMETEKIEEALLAQGYFSMAVPLSYEYQDYMRTYCAAYGCPYPLALAVAEVESNFDMDAMGAIGEVGIMQLNPGPGGSYHAELEAATGLDPTTPAGNIAGGCYLLGKYMAAYEDPAKAAMAYNMGEAGARSQWAEGVTSTTYSNEVLEAVERWECTVNAWNGI